MLTDEEIRELFKKYAPVLDFGEDVLAFARAVIERTLGLERAGRRRAGPRNCAAASADDSAHRGSTPPPRSAST